MPRRKPRPRGPQLELAGALPIAFVNTAAARDKNQQLATTSYADLLTWSRLAGVLTATEAERLSIRAAEAPAEAERVFDRSKRHRSSLFRILRAVAMREDPPRDDLRAISSALSQAMPAIRLIPGDNGITYGWAGDDDALERVLWPVLHSAADFFTSIAGQPLVRQCAAKGCQLFFAIRTPEIKRIWCGKLCRDRAKSLRFYHRKGKHRRDAY